MNLLDALDAGDGVLVNGNRAVVTDIAIRYPDGRPVRTGFSYDLQTPHPFPSIPQGLQHFFHPVERMDDVEIDPEGPWGAYYTFVCHRKDCACGNSGRSDMIYTALDVCSNCYGPITKGVCYRMKHDDGPKAARLIEAAMNDTGN